jgi:hypothetical protein
MMTPEERDRPPETTAQDRLVEEYCLRAQDALRLAPDRVSAEALAEDICDRFSRECASEMVVNATRSFLRRWIAERWEEQA